MTSVSLAGLVRVFARIGILSFGGPAAQIALMHHDIVDQNKWMENDDFLKALSFCTFLPGPEAMQLATYIGWRQQGVIGGLIAGALFVLPGAIIIFGLALLYIYFGDLPILSGAFAGIKATVLIVVFRALISVGKKSANGRLGLIISLAAFCAIFLFNLAFPLVIFASAAVGIIFFHSQHSGSPALSFPLPKPRKTLSTGALWLSLWAMPFVICFSLDQTFLLQVAKLFSYLAISTFGGAYAVLAYMTQTVAQDFQWLTLPQMVDALGLAETTPGPLILVTEFVAIISGATQGGLIMAISAGLICLWVTFVPCFLWIFLGAPYLDWITNIASLNAALKGISAAVVGVMLNLSLWFAMHVLFDSVKLTAFGPMPLWSSANASAICLTLAASGLLFILRLSIPMGLAIMAVLGSALEISF